MRLTQTRISAGTWHGLLEDAAGADAPAIDLMRDGEILAGARLTPSGAGRWTVRATIPADALHDGVVTFVLADAATGRRLAAFSIVAGVPLGDDIRGEIDTLRAEVELLKRALQRLLRLADAAPGAAAAEAPAEPGPPPDATGPA